MAEQLEQVVQEKVQLPRIAAPDPGHRPAALAQKCVSYYDCPEVVHRSARKHGISEDDIHTAAQQYLITYTIDDDQPSQELRLGFDTRGRLLEIVVLLLDDGTELAIHAMKARPQYLDLLP